VRSMRPATGQTRVSSPRQLPTDHDHDGEPSARSANIRVINCRHRRLGLVSATSGRASPCTITATKTVDKVVPYQIFFRLPARKRSGAPFTSSMS
jgi:hypothetical protein